MSDRRSAGGRGRDAPEVHVGGQLPLDEVFISHRSIVQRHRRLQELVLPGHLEHLVRGLPHDERARIRLSSPFSTRFRVLISERDWGGALTVL